MNQWCPPPPCPPPCPTADCVDQALACYNQSKMLEDLVTKVIQDIITNNPSVFRNIPGVTDGSNAAPGTVGEFIGNSVNFTIPTTWNFIQAVTAITLPPGDWNIQAWLSSGSAIIGGLYGYLNPFPTGMSNNLFMELGVYVTTAEAAMQQGSLASPVGRGNFTTSTQLVFQVGTNYLLGGGVIAPVAGTGTIQIGARRVR